MNLIALTDARESERHYRMLRSQLTKGCRKCLCMLGWQGGYGEHVVHWNRSEGFWSVFEAHVAYRRYWCAFGTDEPDQNPMLDIVVECNPPLKDVNRRCAGAFVRCGSKVFLAHSGRIGGGRKGIGKSAFVDSYPQGNWQTIHWSDEHETEMLIIGRVDGNRLPEQIAAFIRAVKQFKQDAATSAKRPAHAVTVPSFSPEFSGKRNAYRISDVVESQCDHGFVVNGLKAELEKRGMAGIGKDRPRDLFVQSKKGQLQFLFEAKTDLSTGSIYTGLGQLVYHGAEAVGNPRRVFVLPGEPRAKTRAVLDNLGIRILQYRLVGTRPVFKNLDHVLS